APSVAVSVSSYSPASGRAGESFSSGPCMLAKAGRFTPPKVTSPDVAPATSRRTIIVSPACISIVEWSPLPDDAAEELTSSFQCCAWLQDQDPAVIIASTTADSKRFI